MSSNGSLLIGVLSKNPRKTRRSEIPMISSEKIQAKIDEDAFYSNLFGDLFLFKELKNSEDSLSVCYNESEICCSLDYKMSAKRDDELFALGVFDGLHTLEGKYYLRICTLIKCQTLDRTSCGQQAFNSSTIFDSFTLKSQLNVKYAFPQVVGDGVTLLPGEWYHDMPVTKLISRKRLSHGLLTAAIFGRVYEYDEEQKNHATCGLCMSSGLIGAGVVDLVGAGVGAGDGVARLPGGGVVELAGTGAFWFVVSVFVAFAGTAEEPKPV
ncbi:Pantetheinase [Exaiptasia diaphana]|nr:Pantetheinase [Exaiptasia diaphana]